MWSLAFNATLISQAKLEDTELFYILTVRVTITLVRRRKRKNLLDRAFYAGEFIGFWSILKSRRFWLGLNLTSFFQKANINKLGQPNVNKIVGFYIWDPSVKKESNLLIIGSNFYDFRRSFEQSPANVRPENSDSWECYD